MTAPPRVESEVGALRQVLVHRPGLELDRVTPTNKEALLFDELLWLTRAQEEHDAFTDLMRAAGTEVLFLHELLEDLLADEEAARDVVAGHVTDEDCGPVLGERVRGFLLDLPPPELVRHLIGGVTLDEVGANDGLVARLRPGYEPVLAPLPNTVFTRDSSAWIGTGAVVAPMSRPARRREADLLRFVYRNHPRFTDAPLWLGHRTVEGTTATVEGGDLLVLGEGGLAVGVSERTTPAGAETLAARLFQAGVVQRVAAVDLPRARATMHLDTVVTQVDRAAFLVYPRIGRDVRCYRLTSGAAGGVRVADGSGLISDLGWAAGLGEAHAIVPELGSVQADREQWNDANNVLALAPGEVIAYERNTATNATLEEAGITVKVIPSHELPRGRGGPRCMTCPVLRDPA